MTRAEFVPVVAYLSAGNGKPMSREQAEVYFDLLSDLPADLVKAAIRRALCESRFSCVPPVGTIRAAAAELRAGGSPSWPEAWRLACQAASRYGLHRQAQGLDSLPSAVRRAAESVGWRALCDADEGSLDTLRAQFRDAYGVMTDREERERRLPGPLRAEVLGLTDGVGALPEDMTKRLEDNKR
jgi:hypothetical protein